MKSKKIVLIIGLLAAIGYVLHPYFLPLIWAAIFAIMLMPLVERVPLKSHKASSAICTIGLLLVIIIPILLAITVAVNEVQNYVSHHNVGQQITGVLKKYSNQIPYGHALLDKASSIDWKKEISEKINFANTKMSVGVFAYLGSFISNTVFSFIFFILFLFSFLNNAKFMKKFIVKNVLNDFSKPEAIIGNIVDTTRGVSTGLLVTGLIVALVMTPVYFLTGLPLPFFFGVVSAFIAMIPFVLPVLYVILAAVLTIKSGFVPGLILLGCGLILNLVTDNIIQPKIIQDKIKMHFLVSLLGVLGGLQTIGILGVFLGPVILNLGYNFAEKLMNKK